jgi:hypothetical protein
MDKSAQILAEQSYLVTTNLTTSFATTISVALYDPSVIPGCFMQEGMEEDIPDESLKSPQAGQ